MDVEEFLSRLDAGENNFSGVDLSGAILSEVDLSGINLSGANLSGADLKSTILSNTDWINLKEALATIREIQDESNRAHALIALA
ncbi:pentapeptide repeat-containing protein, partial [Nostoc sp. PCC 7120 = FACHB-418]